MRKILVIPFLLWSLFLCSQTEFTEEDLENYNVVLSGRIGEKLYIKEKSGDKLPKGEYVLKFMEGKHNLSYWFSIIDSGELDGEVRLNIGNKKSDQKLMRLQIKNGLIREIQQFDQDKEFLERESFYE